ncbi:hypothetical protein [Muricauda aurantiaca]|nr:hypothetical protein [Allomuricauda aurantiaca]
MHSWKEDNGDEILKQVQNDAKRKVEEQRLNTLDFLGRAPSP